METTTTQPNTPLDAQPPAAPQRPQFLTVLCILTWIACGLVLLTTLWGVVSQQTPEEQYEAIEKMREANPEMADRMEQAFEAQNNSNQTIGIAINLVALGLSAFGAYMMWQLKKTGFYLYVAGEAIPYLGFLTGGSQAMSMMLGGPGMMATMIGILVVIDLVFIIMYAVNLKHMRA